MTGSTAAPSLDATLDAELLRLFADPLRLQIVRLLAEEERCTCHLVDETGAKQPTVSHHLRLLKQAGIVEGEPVGAYTYYRLLPEILHDLAQGLGILAQQAATAPRRRLPCD